MDVPGPETTVDSSDFAFTILTLLGKTQVLRYKLHAKFITSALKAGCNIVAVVEDGYPKSRLTRHSGVRYLDQIGPRLGDAYRQGLREALTKQKGELRQNG
jgi:hypothetical protein